MSDDNCFKDNLPWSETWFGLCEESLRIVKTLDKSGHDSTQLQLWLTHAPAWRGLLFAWDGYEIELEHLSLFQTFSFSFSLMSRVECDVKRLSDNANDGN